MSIEWSGKLIKYSINTLKLLLIEKYINRKLVHLILKINQRKDMDQCTTLIEDVELNE